MTLNSSTVGDSISAAKQQLRAEVRARRKSLTPEQRAEAAGTLTQQLIALVRQTGARSVSCFLSLPSEPDTSGFLTWAKESGIEVLLPTSLEGFQLGWIRPSGEGTVTGAHGIDEPLGEQLPGDAVGGVDLMLIPAAAVDDGGMRLGWGLGYYDRCLARLSTPPPVYAVVHDFDVVPSVPADLHDTPVDGVVTPTQVRRFRAGARGRL